MKRLVLLGILVALLVTYREPEVLTEVRRRYAKLNTRYRDVILTGMFRKGPQGDVGYNVNKGYEIFLCLKGDANSVMHVLLHELAHMSVSEYDHSSTFWKNLGEIKREAINQGLYEPIGTKKFCGGEIRD